MSKPADANKGEAPERGLRDFPGGLEAVFTRAWGPGRLSWDEPNEAEALEWARAAAREGALETTETVPLFNVQGNAGLPTQVTPLVFALLAGLPKTVEELLRCGADPDATMLGEDGAPMSLSQLAAKYPHYSGSTKVSAEMIQAALEARAVSKATEGALPPSKDRALRV